jgi:ATP-dependent Zn protease
MFIKLLLIILFIGFLVIILFTAESTVEKGSRSTAMSPEAVQKISYDAKKDSPTLYPDIAYSVHYNPELTKEFLNKIRSCIGTLESLDLETYTEETSAEISQELQRLKEIAARVLSDLKQYSVWEKEHYYATKVWGYLRQRGYNQAVTCAIIGNMMIETSGGTLDLKPNIYSPSGNYYGLCQWSLKYYSGVKDLSYEHQLDYLVGNMPWEFNTFGKNYKKGFTYDDFLKMEDPAEAALAFAKVYERCGPASYELRKQAAIEAYKYFDLNS